VTGTVAGRGTARTPRRLSRVAGAATAGLLGGWLVGFVWFAESAARIPAPEATATDAIVVPTGGTNRLAEGLALLSAGRARAVLVSGVDSRVDAARLLELGAPGADDLACCVTVGYEAADTRGNAAEAAAWMRERGYASVRLVTSNYHMARSLLEFRRMLPGVRIVAHPVEPDGVRVERWWASPPTALLIAREWTKYLVALVRGAPRSPA